MDGEDSLSATRSSYRPTLEFAPEGSCKVPENGKMCSASKFVSLALHEFAACLIDEILEFPGLEVRDDLLVPKLVVKIKKPIPQLCKILKRQVHDAGFDFFDFIHLVIDPLNRKTFSQSHENLKPNDAITRFQLRLLSPQAFLTLLSDDSRHESDPVDA